MSYEVKTISQSSLNTAVKCGEQWRRRYIEGEIIPPGVALGMGRGVHKANEFNLKFKVVEKKDLPLADLKDIARDGFVHTFDNGIFLHKDEVSAKSRLLNEGLNDCLRLTALYRKQVAPQLNPIAVEQKFVLDVEGIDYPLIGYMDYQEKPRIGDIKTTRRKWPDGKIKEEIQPVFYSYAHERLNKIRPRFVYHILVARKKDEEMNEQSHIVTDNQYRALYARLKAFCYMVKSGSFQPASPMTWWCTPRFCGYHASCPYVGN